MSLEDDVRDLAQRVNRLEQTLGLCSVPADSESVPEPAGRPSLREFPRLPNLLGRALLGLAGAYLLRAFTESGTLPHVAGVAAGALYAGLWLVWAARTQASEHLEIALHSLTAVLVLCPLLWEATVRFQAISAWFAAGSLVLFTVFSLAISWRKNILILATIATLATLGTSAGLLIATHDVVPFTMVFLTVAAAVEGSACLGHWLSERWLAALAADLVVLLATWLVTNARGLPPAYAPVPHAWLLAALVLLIAIYLSSTIVRTLFRSFTFTFFEIAQCALALAITLTGSLRLSAEDPRIAPAIGALAFCCAIACYLVSAMRPEQGRNFYTYSTFGILLALTGSRILLPPDQSLVVWLLLAAACLWAGTFYGRFTLQVHGAIYLVLGLVGLGALQRSLAALLGDAGLGWPVYAGAAAAAFCYWLSQSGPLRFGIAAMLAVQLSAIAATALTSGYDAAFGAGSAGSYCATVRTSVLAGGSLLLAWAGARFRRSELRQLTYPVMLLAAYCLVTNEMHQARRPAAVASLVIYGAALMVLPKVSQAVRLARKE